MLETSVSAGVDVGSTWLELGFHPFAKPVRARQRDWHCNDCRRAPPARRRQGGDGGIYQDLRAAGKPPKVALVAVARRMVAIANALIREDITFDQATFA